ncbi:MAG: hypothetical protein RLZZ262_331 [Bacteroidota bacterium]
MPKILILLLIGGVLMPLISFAFVVITNWSLKWSQVATRTHVGEWIWNLLGHLPLILAMWISFELIFTFRTHIENQHGTISGFLYLITCFVPCTLLLSYAFKLDKKNIEVKAFSAPISHAITLLWLWIAITLFIYIDDIREYFKGFAQYILVFLW